MKRSILQVLVAGGMLLFAATGCNDNNGHIIELPSDITNVTTSPGAGNILLKWELPSDSNLFYVQIDYDDPKTNKHIKRQVSKYADSLLISGLLLRNGVVNFLLSCYSETGGVGSQFRISDTPLAAPIDTLVHMKQFDLSVKNVSTNAQEPSGGDIENLFDGKDDTFFHSQWTGSGPSDPHHLEFDFGAEIDGFKYESKNRHNNANNAPQTIALYTSNDKEQWTLIKTLDSGLPSEKGASYTSPDIIFEKPSRYLRYAVLKTVRNASNNGQPFFTLGEMKGYLLRLEIINPEVD